MSLRWVRSMTTLVAAGALGVATALVGTSASAETIVGPAFSSDDFASGTLGSVWSVVDPVGDGSVAFVDDGAGDVRLALGVPGGVSHDAWQTNRSLRIMQSANDADFTAEVAFTSIPTSKYQLQGLLVEQDQGNWLRFDVHSTGSATRVFAARTVNGSSTALINKVVSLAAPVGLQVIRSGSTWSLAYASAGGGWVPAGSFDHVLTATAVGPFAGNAGTNPAFTAEVDYFFDAAAPIDPEDGGAGSGGEEPPPSEDTTPPVISNVQVNAADTSATVSWSTDEPTTGSVAFGSSAAYEFGVVPSGVTATAHTVVLEGLRPDSTYHFSIAATDAAGNTSTTPDATVTTASGSAEGSGPVIDIWYGDRQVFGRSGQPQLWVNVLGNVRDPDGVSSLTYTVDGGAASRLSLGPDLRRLHDTGDFNVEIPYAQLPAGEHLVELTATDALGETTLRRVVVVIEDGTASLPYDTAWSSRSLVSDAAQIVDGPWSLVSGGVRSDVLAYDRTLAIGDIAWTDYEVAVPVTVTALGPGAGTPQSGAPLVGLGLHWQGHTQVSSEQPRRGFYPTGAFAWHRWQLGGRFELLGNDGSPLVRDDDRTMEFGVTYIMKTRAETVPTGVSYSYKVWPADQPEPGPWDLEIVETDGPTSGSVLLIAHHVDAVFGSVVVTPLDGTALLSTESETTSVEPTSETTSVEPTPETTSVEPTPETTTAEPTPETTTAEPTPETTTSSPAPSSATTTSTEGRRRRS